MNNKTLWYIGGAVVAIAVIAVIMMGGKNTNAPINEDGTNNSGETTGAKAMTMKELFASGASQKCSFATGDSQSSSTGTVYQTKGNLRGDFTSVSAGQSSESHMLTDGQNMYVWMNNTEQGFKMSFAATSTQGNQSQGPNLDQAVDYNCGKWSVDQNLFVLPTNITFTDMSALVVPQTGIQTNTGVGGNANQCALCAQAPTADDKAACRAALGCK